MSAWNGYMFKHFERRPDRKKTYPTVDAAIAGFEEQCAALKRERWTPVRYLVDEGDTDPHIVWLPYMLRADLAATAGAPQKKKKTEKPADRSALLTRLVSGRGTIEIDGKATRITKKKMKGRLVLPTGSLVAIDPMHVDNEDVQPFAKKLPPGSYEIELAIAAGRVCAATLLVRKTAPTRWELALPRGMASLVPASRRSVTTKPAYGYPVDVAMGSFMDARALALFQDAEATLNLRSRTTSLRIHDLGKVGTAAVFETGFGDGYYGTYLGFAGRQLACITTDFLVGR